MTTPTVAKKRMNQHIFEAIESSCSSMVENMPETQEYLEERDRLLALIENKVPRKVSGQLEDLCINFAVHWGYQMFRLGIELGRDPSIIFDLPEGE